MPGNGEPEDPPRGLLLGYSTNVHPGEDLDQVYRSLRDYTVPIRDRVFGRRTAGLELRLGIGAARELIRPGAREAFGDFLRRSGLRIFSINAYPLLDFHGKRVKEKAYRPPWTESGRARWTVAIARVFADLLEPGLTGSVSTLGGTYRPWGHGPAALGRMARRYLEVVEALAEIEERTGKRIVLAVEPEPDTTFESAGDLISFYQDHLVPAAREHWKGMRARGRVETLLLRHFTANVDTCHLSVVFRCPRQEMEKLARAGLAIGKVHVSSAISIRRPARSPSAYRSLLAMNEPRYLHQVRGLDDEGKLGFSAPDLDRLPRSARRGAFAPAEVRSHFHVPVHAARWRGLRTTQPDTREAVEETVRRGWCRQLVIETYTWPILRSEDALVSGITREFRWLLQVIAAARR